MGKIQNLYMNDNLTINGKKFNFKITMQPQSSDFNKSKQKLLYSGFVQLDFLGSSGQEWSLLLFISRKG